MVRIGACEGREVDDIAASISAAATSPAMPSNHMGVTVLKMGRDSEPRPGLLQWKVPAGTMSPPLNVPTGIEPFGLVSGGRMQPPSCTVRMCVLPGRMGGGNPLSCRFR